MPARPHGAGWTWKWHVGARWARGPRSATTVRWFRQAVTTLDDHLARGLRVEALRDLRRRLPTARRGRTTRSWTRPFFVFGAPVLRPPSLRDFYAFEGHVRTMWERRGGEVPEAWSRLPIFYFSNVSEIRGPDDPIWSPAALGRAGLRAGGRGALSIRPRWTWRRNGAEEAIGGLHDLQRLVGPAISSGMRRTVRLGPGQGQGLRELIRAVAGDAGRAGRGADREPGYDLAMTADGQRHARPAAARWSDAQFSFGEMLARASADARLVPATWSAAGPSAPAACWRSADATLGRYLEPGDEVVLAHRATRRAPQPDRDQECLTPRATRASASSR